MSTFTGWQYLLIDCANAYGLDKKLFEERIQWATENLEILESLAPKAETKPLFMKAVMAIRKAQAGLPTGHLVEFDATCSGLQIMSCLTGCMEGARATGLVDPDVRADAYSQVQKIMNEVLASQAISVNVPREFAKKATMTAYYGSRRTPKIIFGEDTPELNAFYEAMATVSPGAWDLLQVLLGSWQPNVLTHEWRLPDGFDVKVKVMDTIVNDRLEVDELDHATFSYTYKVNKALPKDHQKAKSLPANVTHSVDAYVLRCIHRRCNYDREVAAKAFDQLMGEWMNRQQGGEPVAFEPGDDSIWAYYVERWEATRMADVVILPHIQDLGVEYLPTELIQKLLGIVEHMLSYKPFPVVTIHDAFKCHANHMGHLRQQYINVLAELAESTVLDDILTSIHGQKCQYGKLNPNLGTLIRGSNYALA
jgi:hypothetical protein